MLRAERCFPSNVFGPVLSPPCNRQRPPLSRSLRLQGVPARVFAPQISWLSFFMFFSFQWGSGVKIIFIGFTRACAILVTKPNFISISGLLSGSLPSSEGKKGLKNCSQYPLKNYVYYIVCLSCRANLDVQKMYTNKTRIYVRHTSHCFCELVLFSLYQSKLEYRLRHACDLSNLKVLQRLLE